MTKKLTWQSENRKKIAILEGREVGMNGAPPYLTKDELEKLKEELSQQAKMGHYLKIKEVALIVFFFFFFYFIYLF
jgi:fructose-1-phosphate kinase PfkB-like protein